MDLEEDLDALLGPSERALLADCLLPDGGGDDDPGSLLLAFSSPTALTATTATSANEYWCPVCPVSFQTGQLAVAHLLADHNIVIDRPGAIGVLPAYLAYYRDRLFHRALPSSPSIALPAPTPLHRVAAAEEGSDVLDEAVRARLFKQRLTAVLARQHEERMDRDFRAKCVFCNRTTGPTRAALIDHMREEHSFFIGRPDNLVDIDDLLEVLR
jgi:hypothetical protein